jgi:hypothetical protein
MKNIYILPTNKLIQNIYITSDEEIKEGDWVFNFEYNYIVQYNSEKHDNKFWYKKIILTTDQDLIKDGVQAIDDEFLEWFVKNPSCEMVEVDLWTIEKRKGEYFNPPLKEYEIIIPQEEPKTNLERLPFPELVKEFAEYYKEVPLVEEPKQKWNPKAGEEVWIKVFSNWSSGKYIGYDVDKKVHLVRESKEGGGHLLSSNLILPHLDLPNEPKQETLELKRNYQKHSLTKTKGYKLWCNIIQRCYNPKNHSYKYYGEKGVVMEDYFKNSYENFIDWIKGIANYDNWLNSSELSLDRIDNTLGYIRGNIKFSTKTEQVENQNLRIDNKSGYKGVCYHKLNKKYGATITINKSKVFLGYYDTALEAALVYDNYVLKNNLNRKTNL